MLIVAPCDSRLVKGPPTNLVSAAWADTGTNSEPINASARLATYRLGDFGAEKITPESLDQTALHELLHVFLHDLMTVAQDPKSSQDEVEMQEHRVINLLEKLLSKDSNGFS